jgi:hypothetical protein
MEERVWGLDGGFAGVVSGVTVPFNVVTSLDGVEFTVAAPLNVKVRSNMDKKMAVLTKHRMADMFFIFRVCICL